jgi:uncharacterized protein (TIGR00255 family)
MIRSMTAFAGHEATAGRFALCWELRSVNHRYLDISMRLPEQFRSLEAEIRTLIGKRVKRGKVECSLFCRTVGSEEPEIRINHSLATSILAAAGEIETIMPTHSAFSALDILKWPAVQLEAEIDWSPLEAQLLESLEAALTTLTSMREREGVRLAAMVWERCRGMREQMKYARESIPNILRTVRTRLEKRIAELVKEPDYDRFEQEIVYLMQKMDVDEELDRLQTHIDEVERVIDQNENGAVGRRLDFLMQEMNREANTLGSKSADVKTTRASVELKVLIEQMREQVQNIE